jgi:hypothetical protein
MAEAMSAAIQRLGLGDRFRHHEVWRVWPTVVGAQIAGHAEPRALRHGRLVVHVTDPVWLHHLSMMRHRLVAAINETLGRTTIRDIVLRVGEVRPPPATPPNGKTASDTEIRPDPADLARIEALLAPFQDAPFRDSLYRLFLRTRRPIAQ